METITNRQTVCFAYFADGKFIGWYGDSFGTIVKNSPKLYGFTPGQVEIITKSFRSKLEKLNDQSDIGKTISALKLIDNSLNLDKTNLKKYKEIELRVVECPFYDGRNPSFDKDKYSAWLEKEQEIQGKNFKFSNCPPELNNWIYADYSKVKEWAEIEPTEFIQTICRNGHL